MIYTLNSDNEQQDNEQRVVSIVRGHDDVRNISLNDDDILDGRFSPEISLRTVLCAHAVRCVKR